MRVVSVQRSSTSNPLERESTAAASGAAAVAVAATPSSERGVGREGAKNSANGEWPGTVIGRRAWPRWKGVESDGGGARARAPKNRCPSTAAGRVGYIIALLLLLSSSSVCVFVVCVCVFVVCVCVCVCVERSISAAACCIVDSVG